MAIKIDLKLTPAQLLPTVRRLFELSAQKIRSIEKTWPPSKGAPVLTVQGRYTSRNWTEWTQGFQYGSMLLQFDATGETEFLEIGRQKIIQFMAPHLSHTGVHDHGFNNISTYGNWLRLMREGKAPAANGAVDLAELALKVSGAVQAARWTPTADGGGFVHSFNGPHSLFVDSIRSMRSLAVAHRLGQVLMGEQDRKISLLERLVKHMAAVARYSIYHGEGRDAYDVRGRTAHECIFNPTNGVFRGPSTQQGYSPFSTWTRGLAWALCGFAEELEFLAVLADRELQPFGGRKAIEKQWLQSALDTADFYIENSCTDGIPLWDTGAPNIPRMGQYLDRPSNPFNKWEPFDSSAAAIAAQGLLRLGNYLALRKHKEASRYRQAGLTIARTLFNEPYLSISPSHQGLILHSVYHRPNGWDYIAPNQKIPNGESSMWGDYHARELALMIQREALGERPLNFFGCTG